MSFIPSESTSGGSTYLGSFTVANLPTTADIGSTATATDALGPNGTGSYPVIFDGTKWCLIGSPGLPATTDVAELLKAAPYMTSKAIRVIDNRPTNSHYFRYTISGTPPSPVMNYDSDLTRLSISSYVHDLVFQGGISTGNRYGAAQKSLTSITLRPVVYYSDGIWYWFAGMSTFNGLSRWLSATTGGAVVVREDFNGTTLQTTVQSWNNTTDSWDILVDDATWMSTVGSHILDLTGRHRIDISTEDGGLNARVWFDDILVYIGATNMTVDKWPMHVFGQGCSVIPTDTIGMMVGAKDAYYLD